MEHVGRLLILIGCVAVVVGILFSFGDRLPFRLGRLPLDFHIERGNYSLYLPLGSSIVVSIVVSLVVMFLGRR